MATIDTLTPEQLAELSQEKIDALQRERLEEDGFSFLEDAEEEAGRILQGLEVATIAIVAGRLGKCSATTIATDIYTWLSKDLKTFDKLATTAVNHTMDVANKGITKMATAVDGRSGFYYTGQGRKAETAETNSFLQAIKTEAGQKIASYLGETVQTSVLYLNLWNGGRANIETAYKQTLLHSAQAMAAGERRETVLSGILKQFRKGLRVTYASGTARQLYSAASGKLFDILTGARRDYEAAHAKMFGADGVRVSAHGLCAPDHLPYQGRKFRTAAFEEIQNSLPRPIDRGYNCRHVCTPIVFDLAEEMSAAERNGYKELSERECLADGQKMTGYEFTQWQRRQETNIRALKAQTLYYEEAGLGGGDLLSKKAAAITASYNRQSKANGIPTQAARLRVYQLAE